MSRRIEKGVQRPPPVTILVDGRLVPAFPGESVATALLAAGYVAFRKSPRAGKPRGPFCMIGSCQECLIRVGEVPVPACQATVREGLEVTLGGTQ
ncbi:MAG: (2Fe-2S)-binding protein [Alphaproteobacteria bacterium]|nr:(2Fe-2S)-binding protein [Alphaproteobacteria bacterium]